MIDYLRLAQSVSYYEDFGFKRIESPWAVSEAISNLTKPEININFQLQHNQKCLVASGEQSFLYLINKGFLPVGKYQTITPCFRDDNFSLIHTKYFMKNELIITERPTRYHLLSDFVEETVVECKNFFEKYLGIGKVKAVMTDIGYDLEYEGIELGSYGIRKLPFIEYIYATGLAEPRMSYCMDLLERK